jgi:hypothetical protein
MEGAEGGKPSQKSLSYGSYSRQCGRKTTLQCVHALWSPIWFRRKSSFAHDFHPLFCPLTMGIPGSAATHHHSRCATHGSALVCAPPAFLHAFVCVDQLTDTNENTMLHTHTHTHTHMQRSPKDAYGTQAVVMQ